ncbi:unnamed protein product [Microthlaspi erraticum]|uniref:Arabidopsis retrotransposon Orf1 C-terminal domain-containing protein n=1 Tax=Microthlaspi erraticum TaxID=1685480 RepID=A0A6D2KGA1_9BRAS|nr:unnamed protein product [Microthlaspi erraticum]
MFQEHYNALFSMDFVETKYPDDDTMNALGIFNDVEMVLKNMHLGRFFSHRMESYKELTCEFLALMRYYMYDEEDRADLDQGFGWITFMGNGVQRKRAPWATKYEGEYSSSRSKAAQIRIPVIKLSGEKRSLNSIELRIELRLELKISPGMDLGEPECYYFEEYEAPRMNPSVVAAHKRIGLLQKFNKWQGKAIEKMQKSMDKMVSKIKSLEKKVSGSSSKKKKAHGHIP